MKIWVDDIRTPPDDSWTWVKKSIDAIGWLTHTKLCYLDCSIEEISLDHDLGGEDTTRPIVIWMIENEFWPAHIYVHSSNPIGVEWLEGMIDRYKP